MEAGEQKGPHALPTNKRPHTHITPTPPAPSRVLPGQAWNRKRLWRCVGKQEVTVGSGCLCSVTSPAWPLLGIAPRLGQQLTSLEPMGSWGPWPDQAVLDLSFSVWEAAGSPAPHPQGQGAEAPRYCRKVTDSAAIPRALQVWHKPRRPGEGPCPPPFSSSASQCMAKSYLILPLHKLSPGVQALNGVHGALHGHLPPVLALWHAVSLLPPAAGVKDTEGQVRGMGWEGLH